MTHDSSFKVKAVCFLFLCDHDKGELHIYSIIHKNNERIIFCNIEQSEKCLDLTNIFVYTISDETISFSLLFL